MTGLQNNQLWTLSFFFKDLLVISAIYEQLSQLTCAETMPTPEPYFILNNLDLEK